MHNNEHDDGEWIEVVKGSTNKIITTAAVIPNDNTFISLEEDHGPRKTNTTITTTPDATPPSNRTYTFSERLLNEKEKLDQKLK